MDLAEWHFSLPSLVWGAVGLMCLFGLVALISPQQFRTLARGGGHWFDTSRLVARLDRPIDVDNRVVRHSRLFGLIILCAMAYVAYVLASNSVPLPAAINHWR